MKEVSSNSKITMDNFEYFNNKINKIIKDVDFIMKEYNKKFFRLWSRNQWKRERLAPSFHLDDFNVDPKTWCRFPILSGGFEEELNQLDQN